MTTATGSVNVVRLKWHVATGAALILAAAAGCSSPGPDADAAPRAPVPVSLATVAVAPVADRYDAGGVVAARTTAAVAARLLGTVRALRVAAGDRVRAGQTLVVLDAPDVEAGARAAAAGATAATEGRAAAFAEEAAAHATLALARASHERIAALHGKRSATAQEFDEATAGLRGAESRVRAAAARVQEAAAGEARAVAARDGAAATEGYLRVVAPFDGVVTETLVEAGAMATPGLPLVRVEDTSAFRAEVRVDEARAAGIAPGTAVELVFDGADAATMPATVSEVSRAVAADARAFLVKVPLPAAPGRRSGTFVRVRFPGDARTALTVPSAAVVRQGQVTSVFVVTDGIARLRLVRLRGTEILAGLAEGDAVVVSPPPGLADGQRVVAGGRR